ncbi:sigma-54-dependent Fis family transcriptional regulator [Nocardia jejuensis]|uniref:sigma-54-dependent Fis family transcriptional regulator n=1 Tax=Nocardia jejuensis TaxID=328049 RepID=UPI0009FD7AF9|nr:helix-turn-helix domain-containing protein [Nocardia jejuensis]
MVEAGDIVRVERARESFLSSGDFPSDAVSGVVSASWRRSRAAGVSDLANVLDRGYVGDLDLESRFVRSALPVIERLELELNDLPVSIALTDRRSRVLIRRDNQRMLGGRFDNVFFAPGFTYAEDTVGTNGVGTALASGRAVFISGPEHFAENITVFACAGAPIRDPLTGAVHGVLDLSCLTEDASPFMRVLVQQAARNIEAELRATGSLRHQAVLERFLQVSRTARGPVLSLGGEVFMSDTRANEQLSPQEKAYLREIASGLTGVRDSVVLEVELPTGRPVRVRPEAVTVGADVAGVVLRVDLATVARAPRAARNAVGMPELPGVSPAWRAVCAEVLEAARTVTPVVLTGETGCGKSSLVTAAHRRLYPSRPLVVVDCRVEDPIARLRDPADDARPPTIVLAHLDELPERFAGELDLHLESRAPGGWLVATMGSAPGRESVLSDAVLRHLDRSIGVPALRHRSDDLQQLVPHLLRTLAPRRTVKCTSGVMRVLLAYEWPGNLTELREALRIALSRRPVGDLQHLDLPETCFAAGRRLSPIENAERTAIVRALVDADGNRSDAARTLGIARSSLYRKIQAYGIRPV